MNQSWSLIVFGFNERDNLPIVVEQALAALTAMTPSQFEVILVDDGSTDGSAELAAKLANDNATVTALLHSQNRGIGQALMSGYKAARFENVCAIPADGQFDAQELQPYVNVQPHNFVSFYRERQIGYSLYRTLLSTANRWLNRLVGRVNLRDVNWVKIYKTEAIKELPLRLKSSLIESEICGKLFRRGWRAIEVPSTYRSRRTGHSKAAGLKTLLFVMAETLTLYLVLFLDAPDETANGRRSE